MKVFVGKGISAQGAKVLGSADGEDFTSLVADVKSLVRAGSSRAFMERLLRDTLTDAEAEAVTEACELFYVERTKNRAVPKVRSVIALTDFEGSKREWKGNVGVLYVKVANLVRKKAGKSSS